jgi:hypothetical protein
MEWGKEIWTELGPKTRNRLVALQAEPNELSNSTQVMDTELAVTKNYRFIRKIYAYICLLVEEEARIFLFRSETFLVNIKIYIS